MTHQEWQTADLTVLLSRKPLPRRPCAAAPAGDTTEAPGVCNGPLNASAVSGVEKSTCKHRTKIRAAGRKDHAVGFHLHSFGHNHHITEEPLAGKTPEKTKIISELLVRQKATSV